MGKQWKGWQTLFSWAPKSLQMMTAAMKLKDTCSLEEIYNKPRQHIKKQRHHFADKGLSSQSYGFSSHHVWMRELDHEEGWVPKNWCFWTVVLERTLESPSDCKEIQPVHSKGYQSWVFSGRTDTKAETPILWSPDGESWLIRKDSDVGKDCGQEEKDNRGWDGAMVSLTVDMNLSKGMVKDREAWSATVHGVTESRTLMSNWMAKDLGVF